MRLNPTSNCTVQCLQEDRNYVCEICGKRQGTEKHHAIFRRDVRYKQLDCAINYQLVCHKCHMELADYKSNRAAFILKQDIRYGAGAVENWIESLPLKVKHI